MGDPVVFVFTMMIVLAILGFVVKQIPGIVRIVLFLKRNRQ